MYSCHDKSRSKPARHGEGRTKLFSYTIRAALLVVLILFGADSVNAQGPDILGLRGLMPRLKKTYKLTSSDVESLTPLIRQENVEMLILYLRFSKDPPEYSDRVWMQIIELRRRFDTNWAAGLTGRHRSALVAASRVLERRMLMILVEDYVDFMAEQLELDDWQFDEVNKAFEWDRKQRQAAVNKHIANLPALHREFAAIAAQTEWSLRRIMTPEQLKELRLMAEKGIPFTA